MTLVLRDVSITVDGVDLSDHCSQVEIQDDADQVDMTGYSVGAVRTFNQGFKDATITATFFQDFAALEVHNTLLPIYQTAAPVVIAIKPTSGTVSPTNPGFEMIALLFQYEGVAGGVGDAAVVDATFHNASDAGLVPMIGGLFPSGLTFAGASIYPT